MNQYNNSNVSNNHHSKNYSNDINTNMGVRNNLNLCVGNNMGVDGNNMGVDGNNLNNMGVDGNNMGVDGNNLNNMGVDGNNMGVDGNNMGVDGNDLNLGIENNMGIDGNNSNAIIQMQKKDEGPKRSRLFVLYGSVLTISPSIPKSNYVCYWKVDSDDIDADSDANSER